MEPKQPGNKKMPDFDKLTDRLIAESPSEPFLVIKTNLDPKESTESNPYHQGKGNADSEEFKEFFEE